MSYLGDLTALVSSCLTCFKSPSLVLNGRQLNIIKLLGEGGFSYVYLVEEQSGQLYAMKKIRCPFGAEGLANAMREVESSKLFGHSPQVISLVDSSVRQEADGSKTVYILLPYYASGTLQDKINTAAINEEDLPEAEIREYFASTAKALRVMHRHRVSGPALASDFVISGEEDRLLDEPGADAGTEPADGEAMQLGEMVPWAHRDIKPGNVMLNDQGQAVLMDLGSAAPARTFVQNNKQALQVQDLAAELCTLPYRAPELVNVKSGTQLSEKVDIWSLGCTIYALMYGISPFEKEERAAGANLNMAILGGTFRFPAEPGYSQDLKDLVSSCLLVDPETRPNVDEILDTLEQFAPVH